LFVYMTTRPTYRQTNEKGSGAQQSLGLGSIGIDGVWEQEFYKGFGERLGGVSSQRVHTLHRHLVLDALGDNLALRHGFEVDLVMRPHHSEILLDAEVQSPAHAPGDVPAEGAQAASQ
jgi:hypothetical protein